MGGGLTESTLANVLLSLSELRNVSMYTAKKEQNKTNDTPNKKYIKTQVLPLHLPTLELSHPATPKHIPPTPAEHHRRGTPPAEGAPSHLLPDEERCESGGSSTARARIAVLSVGGAEAVRGQAVSRGGGLGLPGARGLQRDEGDGGHC